MLAHTLASLLAIVSIPGLLAVGVTLIGTGLGERSHNGTQHEYTRKGSR